MPLPRQRQWRTQNQYQSLNEYNLLKATPPPPGIYLTPTPGNFSLWSGIIFVRSGPYSPAILRFQVALPQQYPAVPPLILFSSDIFHPLITPLTTYTYSTAAPGSVTVSAGDEERLLPGGLSLRHGFPGWFARGKGGSELHAGEVMFRDVDLSRGVARSENQTGGVKFGHRRPLSFHMPPPKEDVVVDEDSMAPSIVEVLYYLKRVFEDETLLDDLPLDIAANPGAWYAWRAHRRKPSKPLPKVLAEARASPRSTAHRRSQSVGLVSPGNVTPVKPPQQQQQQQQQQKKTMADWNWDGVWLERVKKGINMSLSDSVLYGNGEGDDLIHFLNVDDEEYSNFKENLPSRLVSDQIRDTAQT